MGRKIVVVGWIRSLTLLFVLVATGTCRDDAPSNPEIGAVSQAVTVSADGPAFVDITWMSITNVYYQLGSLKILTDGYLTRIPPGEFFGGGGGLARTRHAFKPNAPLVARVRDALGGATAVNLLLTGHSHFDHSFDTATWSNMTGSPIFGSKTTCYQAMAQNVPAERCTPIFGGERVVLSDGVTMRVVRWNHSGDPSSNPEQHNPVELQAVPTPDPVTGGLHAGVAEDFPNGGGARGFLFTVDGPQGRFSWFYQNSASAVDLSVPIVLDGVNYGAPLDNLRAAMSDAGLTSVDLWIGSGGKSIAQLVVPVIRPKAYLPVHWDGLSGAFLAGAPSAFSDSSLESYLAQSSVKLVRPRQYMDKWRLDVSGVVAADNTAVKQALGFAPQAIWREAESAGLTPPMQIASDASAVGGRYVTVAPGNNSATAAPTMGRATFPFTLAAAGTFRIWGRVIAPTTSDDSFWLILDGGTPILWNDIAPGSTWHWSLARDSGHSSQLVQLGLSAGDHVLQVAYREDGAKLDRLLITNDNTLTPSGAGAIAPPAPPGGVAAVGDAQVTVSWTAPTGATGYLVKRGASGGPYSLQITRTSATSATDTAVTSGTQYCYVIVATSGAGESGNSSEACATPL